MNNYYIYTLETNGRIFYIGKTNDPKTRLRKHKSESKLKRTYKENLINKILSNNGNIELSILDIVENGREDFYEVYWISQFKQWGFELCNSTDGGEGGNNFGGRFHSDETKDKLKNARIKKIALDGPTILKGELNGRSKLDEIKVLDIRRLKEFGYSYNRLAIKYEVSKTTIIDIIKRRKWNHI